MTIGTQIGFAIGGFAPVVTAAVQGEGPNAWVPVAPLNSILMKYLKPTGDCVQVTSKDELERADLSLGVTNTNLILYLGVEHVIAACYPPVQVPFAALASLADQDELQRLGPPFITASCPGGYWVGLAMIGKELPHVGFVSPSTEKLPECPSATPACRLSSYLVPGDRVLVGSSIDGFRCVTFRSADGRETSGFLPSAALVDQSIASPALADWTGRWVRDTEGRRTRSSAAFRSGATGSSNPASSSGESRRDRWLSC
jgi:hypothetical protein